MGLDPLRPASSAASAAPVRVLLSGRSAFELLDKGLNASGSVFDELAHLVLVDRLPEPATETFPVLIAAHASNRIPWSIKSNAMGQVRVQFIGSGDAFASGGRFQACLHVQGGPVPLLIDCGATTLVALKRTGIDPASIGWVALSHLHGDHFAGIPWLILDGQFAGRTMPLEIAGPPGTQERVERTFEALYPGATTAARPFETRYTGLVARVPCEFGPAIITSFEVRHQSGSDSYALRVQYGGTVIAYSGDTEWTDTLVDAARGADLFVCECNFFDKQVPGHLDYRTLDSKRAELECERIVLTHMSDDMLGHLDDVNMETASDGAVIAV